MKIQRLDRANVLVPRSSTPSGNGVAEAERRFHCHPSSAFPADADAIIYRPARSAMTSGRASTHRWILEFAPRSAPFIEPLMGWTGGTDPLRHVRLSFASRQAAVAYARRQGLRFTVQEPQERRHLVMPSLDDALIDPSRWFGRPQEVADGPLLTEREKREVLKRWLWDARLIETAVAEGMPDRGEASRLDDLLDALARLEAQNAQPTATADTARAATCRAAANWARAA